MKTLPKLIRTYGLQLWDSAKKSILNSILAFQNIVLRRLSNAQPYVSNLTLHNDMVMSKLSLKKHASSINAFIADFKASFLSHPNPIIKDLHTLTLPDNPHHRPKRCRCRTFCKTKFFF